MPLPFVLNEWIFHDLLGENGIQAQRETGLFVLALVESEDRIVVLRPSPWTAKAYHLMKATGPLERIFSKLLHLQVLQDSERCNYLQESEVPVLPVEIEKDVPPDDLYLFRTLMGGNAKTLITTDTKLLERMSPVVQAHGIEILLRDQFLHNYLSMYKSRYL